MSHAPRNRKREEYLRATGRGLLVTGAEAGVLLARLRSYHARGMTYVQMEAESGVHHRTIAHMVTCNRSRLKRTSYSRLVTMQFQEPSPNAWVSPVGTRRRVSALWLAGYPLPFLAERLGFWNRNYLQTLIRGTKGVAGVRYGNAQSVAGLYEKLVDCDPADCGIEPRAVKFAQTFARKRGLIPGSCWDPDTIDDPEAPPEWTGACGTPFGALAHQQHGIPVCPPCEEAKVELVFSGKKLLALREARGMSQRAVEQAIGLPRGQLHHYERGAYEPRPGRLDQILSALDATFEDVYEEAPSE